MSEAHIPHLQSQRGGDFCSNLSTCPLDCSISYRYEISCGRLACSHATQHCRCRLKFLCARGTFHTKEFSMCRVTRVTNSCGHINDHVEMVCHYAKPISPTEVAAALVHRTNRPISSSTPRYPDPMKLARPISPCHATRYVQPGARCLGSWFGRLLT